MSTLIKKLWEPLLVGVIIVIGIAMLSGKITFLPGWLNLRTLQTFLVGGLGFLVYSYESTDRKDLGPRDVKKLVVKSKLAIVFGIATSIWVIWSQPFVPVNVQLDGVAKTSDLMGLKKDVHEDTKINLKGISDVSDFRKEQQNSNKEFSKNLSDFRNQVSDNTIDLQERQQLTNDLLKELDTALAGSKKQQQIVGEELSKKLDVFDQKISDKFLVLTGSLEKASTDPGQVKGDKDNKSFYTDILSDSKKKNLAGLLLVLAVASFVLSYFWKSYTKVSLKTRRAYIPLALGLIIVLLYAYPVIMNTFSSSPEDKIATKDSVVKKELPVEVKKPTPAPVIVDTTNTMPVPEDEKQDTTLVFPEKKPEIRDPWKKAKKRKVVIKDPWSKQKPTALQDPWSSEKS